MLLPRRSCRVLSNPHPSQPHMSDSSQVIKVAVIEDDMCIRAMLSMMLQSEEGIQCIVECATAEQAIKELERNPADVVFLDLNLPGMNGIDCARKLASLTPVPRIVMLTSSDDVDAIFASIKAGACGYLLKPVKTRQLLEAARDAAAGGSPMASEVTRRVIAGIQSYGRGGTAPVAESLYGLSEREQEIMQLLSEGCLYKEIADKLGISYSTVRTHVERIYAKLQVQSRSQAVAKIGFSSNPMSAD